MLNVRISEEEETELTRYCEEQGLSKSLVVKEALAMYLAQKRKAKSSYAAGFDLFGLEGSGSKDRSTSYKRKLKNKLHVKHAR